MKKNFIFAICFLIIALTSFPLHAQKFIKIGYNIGAFKQKNFFTKSNLNAQSLNFSYEKGLKTKFWTFGLNLEFLEAQVFNDNQNSTIYKFQDQYISLEPNWKYYFGQKANSTYAGIGLPISASKFDLLSGISAKFGFQKHFSQKLSAHIGANYALLMPIDDPGPVRHLNASIQLVYRFPYSNALETAEISVRVKEKVHFKRQTILKLGIGSHLLFVDGPMGGSINAGLERTFTHHWSITLNSEFLGNGQECCDPQKMRSLNQFRFIIQPDVRYYPKKSLKGLYVGTGLGLVGGYGKLDNSFPINGYYRTFAEILFDIKFGFQKQVAQGRYINFFLCPGLLGNLIDQEGTPLFRTGLQIGFEK